MSGSGEVAICRGASRPGIRPERFMFMLPGQSLQKFAKISEDLRTCWVRSVPRLPTLVLGSGSVF